MELLTNHKEILSKIKVLYGNRVNHKPFSVTDLYTVFSAIIEDEYLKETIPTLRAIQDADERREFKKNKLPFFTIGEFRDNERSNKAFTGTQFAIYDYDHIKSGLDEKWAQITSDPRVFAAFHSPSGDGLKVIYRFHRMITGPAEFSNIYKTYAKQFNIELGEEPDKTSDSSRACFFSFDPELHFNPKAEPLDADIKIDKAEKKKKLDRDELLNKLEHGIPAGGNRTPVLVKALGMLYKKGIDRDFARVFALGWNRINENPLADQKVIDTVNDTYSRYATGKCEGANDYYSYEAGVIQAKIVGDEFSIAKIGKEKYFININAMTKDDELKYYTKLVKERHIHSLRRIDYVGDAEIEKSHYRYIDSGPDEGVFDVHIAAAPAKLQDNQFIESYLEQCFGQHKDFIKKWMAIYCYTNYRKLPHLIFTGPRGTFKSTVSDMIAGIFNTLSNVTKELEGDFNPDGKKKLIVIDECDNNGRVGYNTLKKYSGQRYIDINEKYVPKHKVRNNTNIIILSNHDDAIIVERQEMPKDECNNQFFVYKFQSKSGTIDPDYIEKLLDRIGHYVRTELKDVFGSLNFTGYRYSIPVPITEWEMGLFETSVSEVEAEADKYIQKLLLNIGDPTYAWRDFIKAGYLPTDYFSEYSLSVSKLKVIKDLQRRGYLKRGKAERAVQIKGQRPYCYRLGEKWHEEIENETKGGSKTGVQVDVNTQGPDLFAGAASGNE